MRQKNKDNAQKKKLQASAIVQKKKKNILTQINLILLQIYSDGRNKSCDSECWRHTHTHPPSFFL